MYSEEVRDIIRNNIWEDVLFIGKDNDTFCFDNSIVGITEDCRLVYDYESILHELMKDFGWSQVVAEEFYDNTLINLVKSMGEKAPILTTNINFYDVYNLARKEIIKKHIIKS